jgi:hypothetical protein
MPSYIGISQSTSRSQLEACCLHLEWTVYHSLKMCAGRRGNSNSNLCWSGLGKGQPSFEVYTRHEIEGAFLGSRSENKKFQSAGALGKRTEIVQTLLVSKP